MKNMELKAIVEKVQAGDAGAFEELYKATAGTLHLKAAEYMRNEQDVEDVLQESYVKIYNKIGTLDNPEKFLPWARQIVSNTCIDMLRKSGKTDELLKPEISDENYQGMEDIPVSEIRRSFNPEDHVDGEENARLIRGILEDVPDAQRAALVLWGEGKTYSEIAHELGVAEGTAKANVFFAKKKVKEKTEWLEKSHGIFLHGLAPVAFFVFLIAEANSAETVSAEVLPYAEALWDGISRAVGSTTKAAGGAVLKAAGAFFKGSVARKAVAAVIVFTAGAAIIATAALYKPDNAEAGAQPSRTIEAEKEPEHEPEKSDTKTPAVKKDDKTEKDNDDKKDTETSVTTSSSGEKQEEEKSDEKTEEDAETPDAKAAETKDAAEVKKGEETKTETKPSGNDSKPSNGGNTSKPAQKKWVVDKAAWDETVVDKPAWDETVTDRAAYDEQVVDQPAWDEQTPYDVAICQCGAEFATAAELTNHQAAYLLQGNTNHVQSRDETRYTIVHHDATYKTVHHDAVTHTVHHDAVTHTVHHDEQGHWE